MSRKWKKVLLGLCLSWFVEKSCLIYASIASNTKVQRLLTSNPLGLRLFHPAFLLELTKPVSLEEADEFLRIQQAIAPQSEQFYETEFQRLPWCVFSRIGIRDSQVFLSNVEVQSIYEKTKHLGSLVWAHKLEKPEAGCLLINHWDKRLVFLAEYSPERGAKGFEIRPSSPSAYEHPIFNWPPFTLEHELVKKLWQPVSVSENLLNPEFYHRMPKEMQYCLWEIIFLILTSKEDTPRVYEALFDTGISPKQGMISYLRLLEKVMQRAEVFDGIPEYRQIIEQDIVL